MGVEDRLGALGRAVRRRYSVPVASFLPALVLAPVGVALFDR